MKDSLGLPPPVSLSEAGDSHGPKARNLARVMGLGFPVLPGEAFSNAWFQCFLQGPRGKARFRHALSAFEEPGASGALDGQDPVDPEFRKQLQASLAALALPFPWILRSSSGLEDGTKKSFAGGFLSLGPRESLEAATEAVLEIFDHATSPQTLARLLLDARDPREIALGILVQPYRSWDLFAVALSRDPQNPEAGVRIEATRDDPETFMQGAATRVELDPRDREQVKSLEQGLRAEFGIPLDLELGRAQGKWWVLQVRPQVLDPAQDPRVAWDRSLTKERYPQALSPYGGSGIEVAFGSGIRSLRRFLGIPESEEFAVARRQRGWIEANPEAFDFASKVRLEISAGAMARNLARAFGSWALRGFWLQDLRDFRAGQAGRGPRLGEDPGGFAAGLVLDTVLDFWDQAISKRVGDFEALVVEFRAELDAVDSELERALSAPELVALEARLRASLDRFLAPDLVIYALKEILSRITHEVADLLGLDSDPDRRARAFFWLEPNPTLEYRRDLQDLARIEPEDYPASRARRAFLERYGHTSESWDVYDPPLGERPEDLDRLVASLRGRELGPLSSTRDVDLIAERAQRLQSHPALKARVETLQARLEEVLSWDERHHWEATRVLPVVRKLLRQVGRELRRKGVLEAPQEVYFLEVEEAYLWLSQEDPLPRRGLVRRRREVFLQERARGRPSGEELLGLDTQRIQGVGASRGRAMGPARKVRSLADLAALEPGEVLVLERPDPLFSAGFPLAAAMVSETGALLSHGLLAAREVGIPAVIQIPGLFAEIREGELLGVDGNEGVVLRQGVQEPEGEPEC